MTDQALDSISNPAVVPQVPAPMQATPIGWRAPRPARVLLGWLPSEQGEFLLANHSAGRTPEEQRARVLEARSAVASRPAGISPADTITALPAELADHAAQLASSPAGAAMLAEGWETAMVDLGKVIAFQPNVFTDTTADRVADLDPGDLKSITALTLPISDTAPVSVQYDNASRTYTITSPNPNLKVAGNFDDRSADGTPGFGFRVTVMSSFMQVARFQGRLVLRDGYHRAYGLLSRGMTRVPAYVCDFDTTENLAPAGMLPQNTWPRITRTDPPTWPSSPCWPASSPARPARSLPSRSPPRRSPACPGLTFARRAACRCLAARASLA